jgi:hypothetical protein
MSSQQDQQPMLKQQLLPSAYTPQLLSTIRNPLLSSRLVNYHEMDKTLPLHGRHINASFTRDKNIVSKFLSNEEGRVAKHISDETKQMALDSGIIVVYQAFNRGIVRYAAEQQKFLGAPGYNPERMTWCKTSFQWMMFRCEWATRDVNQERVVAITLPIAAFDEILKCAVESSHHHAGAGEQKESGSDTEGKESKTAKKYNESKKNNTNVEANDNADNEQQKEQEQKEDVRKMHEKERAERHPPCPAASRPPSKNDTVRLQFDPEHVPTLGKRQRRTIQLGLKGETLKNFHKWILCIDDITDSLVTPGRPLMFDGNKTWMEGYIAKKEEEDADESEKVKRADEDPVIFQPLEELYVPLDSKVSHHIGLTILLSSDDEGKNQNGNDDD